MGNRVVAFAIESAQALDPDCPDLESVLLLMGCVTSGKGP